MLIQILCLILFVCIPLPFLLHAVTLYNIMNAFEDVIVTETPVYFYGLFMALNCLTFIYTFTYGKTKPKNINKFHLLFITISLVFMFSGTLVMYYYSDENPLAGISLICGGFGIIYLYLAMEIPIKYISKTVELSDEIKVALPSLVISFFNIYGVPISIVSLFSDKIDMYLIICLIMTVIISISLYIYLIKMPKDKDDNIEIVKELQLMPFKDILKNLLKDSTTYWSMLGLIFVVIGTNINYPTIVSGFINEPVDSNKVEEISIDQYIKATIISQLVVIVLAFIPIVWEIIVSKKEISIKNYKITNWICKNILVIVFNICLIGTMICIGIGNENSLIVQTYFNTAFPISFFSTCFIFYSKKYKGINQTMIFGLGLAIASIISFIQLAIEDWYQHTISSRILIIIPCFLLLISMWIKLYFG